MFAEQSIRRTFLWLILIALAVTVAITMTRHDVSDLSGHDFASLLIRVSGLVLIGGAAIAMFRDNFAQAVKSALIWFVIALVLVVGYTYRFELKDASNRVMAELMPGRAATKGRTVELARRRRRRLSDFDRGQRQARRHGSRHRRQLGRLDQ